MLTLATKSLFNYSPKIQNILFASSNSLFSSASSSFLVQQQSSLFSTSSLSLLQEETKQAEQIPSDEKSPSEQGGSKILRRKKKPAPPTPKPGDSDKEGKIPLLKLSKSAVERLTYLLKKKPTAAGIKIGTETSGCSGLSYSFKYVMNNEIDEANKTHELVHHREKDENGEMKDVKVWVKKESILHLFGTTMDFVEDELTAQFVFLNPQAKNVCGCGHSFQVEGFQKDPNQPSGHAHAANPNQPEKKTSLGNVCS